MSADSFSRNSNERKLEILKQMKKSPGSDEEMIQKWLTYSEELKDEERLDLLNVMVENDLWFWMPVISFELGRDFGRPLFMQMVSLIASRLDARLAGEIYWEHLVHAGRRMPAEVEPAVRELISRKEGVSDAFASALLAGMMKVEKEKAMELLKQLLGEWDAITVAMKSMIIAIKEGDMDAQEAGPLVLSIRTPAKPHAQSAYSMALRLVHEYAPEEVERRFMELIPQAVEWVKWQALYDFGAIQELSDAGKKWLKTYYE